MTNETHNRGDRLMTNETNNVVVHIKTKTVYVHSINFNLGSIRQAYSFESDVAFEPNKIVEHMTDRIKAAVCHGNGRIAFYSAVPNNPGVLTKIFDAQINEDTREEVRALFAEETQIENNKAKNLFTLLIRKGN